MQVLEVTVQPTDGRKGYSDSLSESAMRGATA
jgi:hypothetical protein